MNLSSTFCVGFEKAVSGKSEKNGPWLQYAYPTFHRYFKVLPIWIAEFPALVWEVGKKQQLRISF